MNVNNLSMGTMLTNSIKNQNYFLNKITKQLSSGKPTPKPADILRMSRYESDIRGNQMAQNNIQSGISLVQTAQVATQSMIDNGQSLRELAVKYNSEISTDAEKELMREEAKALLSEINNAYDNTKFNGVEIFKEDKIIIQTGTNPGDNYEITIPKYNVNTDSDVKDGSELLPDESYDIDKLLNTDVIDKLIIDPFKAMNSSLGISESILDIRMNLSSKNEEVISNHVKHIEGVEQGKLLLEKTKRELLLEANVSLLAQVIDNSGQVLKLLS